jgi:hypothetical protein
LHERTAVLPVRQDTALDAPRIEQHGVPRPIVVPEIGIRRQQRADHFLTFRIDEPHAAHAALA